jgi:hypothetical protein
MKVALLMAAVAVLSDCSLAQSVPAGQVSTRITAVRKASVEKTTPPAGLETKPASLIISAIDHRLLLSNASDATADTVLNSMDGTLTAKEALSRATSAANALPADQMPIAQKAMQEAATAVAVTAITDCPEQAPDGKNYTYPHHWLPVGHCASDGVKDFFNLSNTLSIATTVQYLYNPVQSTSQLSADLFTGTFPFGFQAILSGTATAGSSTTAAASSQSGSGASSPSSTDSVATAVAKLEQGGDFNVRFPYPIYFQSGQKGALYALTSPAIGFDVSGLTGQNTITQSTEYNFNLPLEIFGQTGSLETDSGVSSATLYFDAKPSMELVSPDFATTIGLKSSRYFFLMQADAGIEFAKSARVGFQYFYGPSEVYQAPTTTGTTMKTNRITGLHLVVSFTPGSSKKS